MNDDGSTSIYMHMNRQDVHVGQVIQRGDPIGLSGNTEIVRGSFAL